MATGAGYAKLICGGDTMKDKVLDLLTAEDGFVSGQLISRKLGVTRAAVWKTVKSLQEAGYPIEAVPRKGYRIDPDADVLTARLVEASLRGQGLADMISRVVYESRTDSTNLMAKRYAEDHKESNILFIAARQENGRGRRGRTWISDSAEGLWFSLLLRPGLPAADLSLLTLFAGMCAAEALSGLGADVGLKWPNDLVARANGRKLGGILTEMMIEENMVDAAVIGIGINISNKSFPAEIESIATSLHLAGIDTSRITVLSQIAGNFFSRWHEFLQGREWLNEYTEYSLTLGKQVKVIGGGREILRGIATGLDINGELIVTDEKGQPHLVNSGEVSVRGLLGE